MHGQAGMTIGRVGVYRSFGNLGRLRPSMQLCIGNELNCAIQRLKEVGWDSRPGNHDCKGSYIIYTQAGTADQLSKYNYNIRSRHKTDRRLHVCRQV